MITWWGKTLAYKSIRGGAFQVSQVGGRRGHRARTCPAPGWSHLLPPALPVLNSALYQFPLERRRKESHFPPVTLHLRWLHLHTPVHLLSSQSLSLEFLNSKRGWVFQTQNTSHIKIDYTLDWGLLYTHLLFYLKKFMAKPK